ncbi:MAG: molybdenum cofactor cytidylyltransferase [Chloroflexota bacterium]
MGWPVGGIILAAGRGSRLGTIKQLLPLGGRPLVAHVLLAAEASSWGSLVVVLGFEAEKVAAALPAGRARVVYNGRYAEGQSTSLQEALQALGEDVEAALVLLGDQPGVSTAVIDAVVDAARRGWRETTTGTAGGGTIYPLVVIPTYGGQDGHPVLLHRALWPEVMALRGDQGARPVIRAHARSTLRLAVAEGPPPPDVDTAADYAALAGEMER